MYFTRYAWYYTQSVCSGQSFVWNLNKPFITKIHNKQLEFTQNLYFCHTCPFFSSVGIKVLFMTIFKRLARAKLNNCPIIIVGSSFPFLWQQWRTLVDDDIKSSNYDWLITYNWPMILNACVHIFVLLLQKV